MGSKRVFNMRCSDQETFTIWQLKLRHSINSSIGKLKGLTLEQYQDDVSKFFEFWRFLRIDENMFKYQAEVGDLILCKSKKSILLKGSKGIDKICLVMKLQSDGDNFNKSELFVLRVGTSLSHPIVLQSWEEFRIHKNQKYQDCWFRHLYCDRDDKFLKKTQIFIQKIREEPYKDTTATGKDNAKRLYRNAELVAKFYKFVGMIPSSDTNASVKQNFGYEPKDFCQDSKYNLQFNNSSSLSDEHIIMFDEKDI